MLLLDAQDPSFDEALAEHLLEQHTAGGGGGAASAGTQVCPGGRASMCTDSKGCPSSRHSRSSSSQPAPCSATPQHWPVETLRQYIAWAKQTFHPTLSEEAEEVLSRYYNLVRQHAGRSAGQGTVRKLESLLRVAQAHSRLMARGEVTLQVCLAVGAINWGCLLPMGWPGVRSEPSACCHAGRGGCG